MIKLTIDNNTDIICHATDCIIDETLSIRPITGPQSPWEDYIGDSLGYTINVPGLVDYSDPMNYLQIQKAKNARKPIAWAASAFQNGGIVHSGMLLITHLNQTTQMRDVMKFEMDAVGCGELITQKLPIVKTVYLAGFDNIQLPGCPNPYPIVVYWYDHTPIGPALNADDVVSVFNNYIGNVNPNGGLYYTLSVGDSGCNFIMSISYDALLFPNVVYAEQGAEITLWDGRGDNAISNDQDNDNVISPIYA